MNAADRKELRTIVEDVVAPVQVAAEAAAAAAGEAKAMGSRVLDEINGMPGTQGIKERLGRLEEGCEARHGADATAQRQALDAAAAKALAPRASDRPSSRSAKLQIARWHAVAAIVAALAGVATAWLVGRTGAPSTPPAQAAPKR